MLAFQTYKKRKTELRNAARDFIQKAGIDVDINALEVYIAGNDGVLCALPDKQPKGLVNDIECIPYPVLECDMNTMAFTFTNAGKDYFKIAT